jgi:hypothetical protein
MLFIACRYFIKLHESTKLLFTFRNFANAPKMHLEFAIIPLSVMNVKDLLSSSLLSKNTNIKIYRTIILPVVFMGVKLGLSH